VVRYLIHEGGAVLTIREQAALVGATEPAGAPGEILPLAELERRACAEALVRFGGNIAYAARALGIARGTLYAKMKRYGIPVPETTPSGITASRRAPRST
jgi:transcriptional regulator of acetoin/glycerol metabolism